jgi:hypothetical protein
MSNELLGAFENMRSRAGQVYTSPEYRDFPLTGSSHASSHRASYLEWTTTRLGISGSRR